MIVNIKKDLEAYYSKLNTHPIYKLLKDETSIVYFMQTHIYSVWDFMNLLKYLQMHLTCLSLPWKPFNNAKLSRLINEIVLEEESDIIEGKPTSHFMYYAEALMSLDSSCSHINTFIKDLYNDNTTYKELITKPYIPNPAKNFLNTTYQICNSSLLEVASAFTFGRENLVPTLFDPIVDEIDKLKNPNFSKFIQYLKRHIQLDGEEHSKLSLEMIETLIQSDKDWHIVKKSAINALNARILFWDSILKELKEK